ncbi:MAG: hypothetical protein ABF629_15390, partial [Sporolactobacillus sp.]
QDVCVFSESSFTLAKAPFLALVCVFKVLNHHFGCSLAAGAPQASSDKQKSAGSRWHLIPQESRTSTLILGQDTGLFV